MGYIKIVALVVAFLAMFLSLFKPVVAASKLEELQELQKKDSLIEFGKEEFKKYVAEDQVYDYDMIIYYTLSKKWDHCVQIEEELKQVAYSYVQSGKCTKSEENPRPIFFSKIEYGEETGEFFVSSDFNSVPILALLSPETKNKLRVSFKLEYPEKHLWKISTQDFFDAGKILEHVNKITHNNIELKYTLYRIMAGNIIIFGAIGVLFFFRDYIGLILQNKIVWMIGTSIIFIQCVGGIAFNMIHKVPTFRYAQDENGEVYIEEYFQRSQRSQYSGEGYMASMLMFSIGALMVLYAYVNRIKNTFTREVVWLVLIVAIFFGIVLLQGIFALKASHYSPSFYPPDHYMKGPLSIDQGTNI
jgi:hypothetical protein